MSEPPGCLQRSKHGRRLRAGRARHSAAGTRHGFGLLELLVALTVSVLMLGGVFTMLYNAQAGYKDFGSLGDARQSGRLALMHLQRDLARAGVGLSPMKPVFPYIVPQDDGGVLIRMSPSAETSFLTDDMDDSRRMVVDSTVPFGPGMKVAVYDALGAIDFAEVVRVNDAIRRVTFDRPLSKLYQRIDGTAVIGIQEISYRVENVDGVSTLMRDVVGETPQPIVQNVVRFGVTYYDNSTPPVSFQPADAEEQANIRAVEIELVLVTESERLNLGERQRVQLRTRVAPRSMTIS